MVGSILHAKVRVTPEQQIPQAVQQRASGSGTLIPRSQAGTSLPSVESNHFNVTVLYLRGSHSRSWLWDVHAHCPRPSRQARGGHVA